MAAAAKADYNFTPYSTIIGISAIQYFNSATSTGLISLTSIDSGVTGAGNNLSYTPLSASGVPGTRVDTPATYFNASTFCDFNRDGRPDAFTAAFNSITLWTQAANGTFQASQPIQLPTGATVTGLDCTDVNFDGIPDLIVGGVGLTLGAPNSLAVYLGNGNGGFQPPVLSSYGSNDLSNQMFLADSCCVFSDSAGAGVTTNFIILPGGELRRGPTEPVGGIPWEVTGGYLAPNQLVTAISLYNQPMVVPFLLNADQTVTALPTIPTSNVVLNGLFMDQGYHLNIMSVDGKLVICSQVPITCNLAVMASPGFDQVSALTGGTLPNGSPFFAAASEAGKLAIGTVAVSMPASSAPVTAQPKTGSGLVFDLAVFAQLSVSPPSGHLAPIARAATPSLSVVNILYNNFLDGRHACYLAYVVASSTLILVDDAGDAGGPYAGSVTLGSNATIQNGQCAVNLTSAINDGTTLTLGLHVVFKSAFGGNKIDYLAARDSAGNNTGWIPGGTWGVPPLPAGQIVTVGAAPAGAAVTNGTAQPLVFTLTDSKGTADFGVVNVLINNDFIDGRSACYLAYVAPTNTLYLIDDAGNAGGPFAGSLLLNGNAGTIQNGQCSISGAGSSAAKSGNTLTLTLNTTFQSAFKGSHVVWLAGRDKADGNNTDWQSIATVIVQ
jgi:hypothetical protein